ncbi:MAG: HAMP domain-containing histidine kinase, partial [Proteobacteria bacterium]|nr:HAMP domain-containing histidine kinase [Pseudomonadota bacterium]
FFFLAVAIPTALLIQQSYSQLKWEAFHQHQITADELATRIDNQFIQLIATEEQRPFTDYSFLNVAGDPAANFFQRSPLSQFPVESAIPGMIGYFQVDSQGQLMTPLLPDVLEQAENYGIAEAELVARTDLFNIIESILSDNRLVLYKKTTGSRVDEEQGQDNDDVAESGVFSELTSERLFSRDMRDVRDVTVKENETIVQLDRKMTFDDLKNIMPSELNKLSKYGRVEDLKLEQRYQQKAAEQALITDKKSKAERSRKIVNKARKEQSVLPESIEMMPAEAVASKGELAARPSIQANLAPLAIQTFASEIEPFEFSLLDSGHFVLYRNVWRNEQRYIQGLLIEQQALLNHMINLAFRETALSQMTNLLVAFQGNVLEAFSGQTTRGYLSSAQDLNGELLYQTSLSAPLSEVQLLFSITQLPAGPGGVVIKWLAFILAAVLSIGFYLMYRLVLSQINLANQQQDFVSSVSHELKTPLTSIRMYGEMLREGWVSEDKKKTYYDFIFDESERLSRLINNVLLMAKLTRNSQHADLKQRTVAELIDEVKSKVSSQIDRAEFDLTLSCDEQAANANIMIDADWFSQVMINLVDNAIKFSAHAEVKLIELSCQQLSDGKIQFKVRDYGPGIAKQQMKKIFQLFYRSESELTRETVGTGIGLALVHQMIVNMNGQIDVVNTEPGAEFRLLFPNSD